MKKSFAIKKFYIYFAIQSTLNMEERNYLKDIQDIKSMMDKSSQFISLSGLSGVLAGIYALIGAYIVKFQIASQPESVVTLESLAFKYIIATAATVLILSVVTAFIFTHFKAKKENEKVWNSTSKRMAVNFLIPLLTGGIFAIILVDRAYYELIAPVTLLFYGLSCINASKYTLRDVRYLGITIVILGLLSAAIPGYTLEFWALGFGVCHIIYGSIMHFKYDSK